MVWEHQNMSQLFNITLQYLFVHMLVYNRQYVKDISVFNKLYKDNWYENKTKISLHYILHFPFQILFDSRKEMMEERN
jgi:predicted metallopeptidase